MKQKPIMAQRIQELRKAQGITQAQLAAETGLKETAVRSYENGLREPNSKAMAALERYFRVSGEYLRGEIDRDTFFRQSEAIQGQLDELISLFQAFRVDFDCSSQERQLLADQIHDQKVDVLDPACSFLLHFSQILSFCTFFSSAAK